MSPLRLPLLSLLLLLVLLLPAAVQPREGNAPVQGGALGTLQRMVAVEEQELNRLEKVVTTHRVLIPGSSSMRFSVPAKILATAAPKACPAPCQKAWYVRCSTGRVGVDRNRACVRGLGTQRAHTCNPPFPHRIPQNRIPHTPQHEGVPPRHT